MVLVSSQEGRTKRFLRALSQGYKGRTGWVATLSGVAGALLLAFAVDRVGYRELLGGMLELSWGFVIVVALGGLRFAVRSTAWVACVRSGAQFEFLDAWKVFIASDAIGTLTPAGPLASEPAKIMLASGCVPPDVALTSLTIENIVYTLSVALMIVSGAIALLATGALGAKMAVAATTVLAVFVLVSLTLMAATQTRARPVRWLASRAGDWWGQSHATYLMRRVADFESGVLGFAAKDRARWLAVLALEIVFHALAVFEIWATLLWILPRGTGSLLLGAFILESTNRLITVLFKFVPLRLGVDEAGTGLVSAALGIGTTAGVTLALVRKARTLCWTAVGVAILLWRGWSAGRANADSGDASGRCS